MLKTLNVGSLSSIFSNIRLSMRNLVGPQSQGMIWKYVFSEIIELTSLTFHQITGLFSELVAMVDSKIFLTERRYFGVTG